MLLLSWKARVWLFAGSAAAVAGAFLWYQEAQALRPVSDLTWKELERVEMGTIEAEDVRVEYVIWRLNDALARAGSALSVAAWDEARPPGGFRKQTFALIEVPLNGLGGQNSVATQSFVVPVHQSTGLATERVISLTLEHAECGEVLRHLAERAGTGIARRGNKIFLLPERGTIEPMLIRNYTIKKPRRVFRGFTIDDAEERLRASGVLMYEGCSATLTKERKLTVCAPSEHEIVAEMWGAPDPTILERLRQFFRARKE